MKDLKDILKTVGSTVDFGFSPITDVRYTTPLGDTPLHCVSTWGDAEAAAVLIKAGAIVNARGEYDQTPIYSAIGKGSLDTVKVLIDAGADLSVVDTDGITPLEYAQRLSRNKNFQHVKEIVDFLERLTRK
jgi:uncharacterized protein